MGMGGDFTTVAGCPRLQGQKVPWSAYFSLRASDDAGSKAMLHEMLMLGTTREFHVAKRPTTCVGCSFKTEQTGHTYIYIYIYIYVCVCAGKCKVG